MISKLCYLFTFITSILNLLDITSLKWSIVFIPSIIALIVEMIILIIALSVFYRC